MKRIPALVATIIILLLTLTGCSFNNKLTSANGVTHPNYYEIELSDFTRGRVEYLGLLSEDSILYYDPSSRRTDYYIYNFSTRENRKVGEIDNYYLDVSSATLLNDSVYFYIAQQQGSQLKNILCQINPDSNTLNIIEKEDSSLPGLYIYTLGDGVITLKNERVEQYITTYLDIYYPSENRWEKHNVNVYDSEKISGSALYVLYADGETLYTIEDRYEGDICNSYLVTYDQKLQQKNNIQISGELLSFMNERRINGLYLWDDYIYVKNIANDAFIGYIDGDEIKKVFAAPTLLLCGSLTHNNSPVFYTHSGNTFYSIDENARQVQSYTTKDVYQFIWALSSPQHLVLITNHDENGPKQMYLEKKDLQFL